MGGAIQNERNIKSSHATLSSVLLLGSSVNFVAEAKSLQGSLRSKGSLTMSTRRISTQKLLLVGWW